MIKTALKVGYYYQEFKYLGVNISTKNNMNNEIQLTISAANKDYFSSVLYPMLKKERYTYYLWPIVIYTSETWSITQGDVKNELSLKKKFYEKFTGLCEFKKGNMKDWSRKVVQKPNIRIFLKTKRGEWAVHANKSP